MVAMGFAFATFSYNSFNHQPERHRDVNFLKATFFSFILLVKLILFLCSFVNFQVPEDHFQALQDSGLPEDKTQLEQETQALEKIRKLELVAVMSRRKLLPEGFELCMCDIVHEILHNPDQYHLYFKYLKALQVAEVYLLVDVVKSFASVMSNLDPSKGGDQTQQTVKIGFHLIDFLADYGYFKEAELIMTVLLKVLNRSHNIETWMSKYKGFVKLMKLRNMNYEFRKVQSAYNLAIEMTWQIKMMSFGQDIIDETELFTELSQLMFEYGSASSSQGWIQKALRMSKESAPETLINTLCNAVISYCAKWMIKKAEQLAIFTVRKAAQLFGKRHPLYLKALLHFCFFSNEFKQDKTGVDTAKYTLETAKKIYGCDTIQVALAHRALCKAMLAVQTFDNLAYYLHATEGLKLARALLPENHPMLYLFLHTSATALQWKALHSSKAEQEATLNQAELECKEALDIVSNHYGEISLRTGQMCLLLGQIYSKMDKILLAEEMLQRGVMYMKLCQSDSSNFLLLAAATLGTFYKIFDKPREAIVMLQDVIKNLEPVGMYLKWVHVCYEHLISTLQSLNRNKEADEVQIQLSQWLRDNKVNDHVITLEELHTAPESYSKFMDEFDAWDKAAKKILSLTQAETAGNLKVENIFQKK
ncbi:hypothetical protein KUTeg_016262 [Tegillarca granosa]|uniref:MAU2 chromatid cohesion factor homolog n=1 Tax=Tegillarca granosa TaxID=220873 RepID=A0ABQ9EP56_TEGGR|nr:hypothetical protein KUTeg_016262 [Tegillarca granosa]